MKEANQRMASTGGDEMAEHWLFLRCAFILLVDVDHPSA